MPIPVKGDGNSSWEAIKTWPSLDLQVLGFCKSILTKNLSGVLERRNLVLETHQLQAMVWFARKLHHHMLHSSDTSLQGIEQSAGSIVANEPGTGKTIMAITKSFVPKLTKRSKRKEVKTKAQKS